MEQVEVLVVGAGAAGVGIGVALKKLELNFGILERHKVGASFTKWPKETRFITPSFTSNAFNLPDLNALTPDTSPAFTLGKEHPSGVEYARYLGALAQHYELPVAQKTTLTRIEKLDEGFIVYTNDGAIQTRFVIWAVGEFQFPRYSIPGSEVGIHYGRVKSWESLEGNQHLIVGGYESGIDAAHQLAMQGKQALVLDPQAPWDSDSGEPSLDLSPYTHERLEAAMDTGLVKLARLEVQQIEQRDRHYELHHAEGTIRTPTPPIIATGFGGGFEKLQGLLEFEGQRPILSEHDESTVAPGLFLAGPKVNHRDTAFCFIYKFRGRFPVVASAIADRLEVDTAVLEIYRKRSMWADDLEACCDSRCAC